MGILQHTVDQAGALILTIPSALIIIISREWFAARMTGEKTTEALKSFSLLSFACLALNGTAPGGLLRDRPYALLRFLYGQLWLLILIAVGVIYVMIKGPSSGTFAARFSAVYLSHAWSLLILNFLPFPPFDAALAYFAPYMQWKLFSVITGLLSFSLLVVLTYDFWRMDWITGKFMLEWLRLV
jgi:hypothetical protein